MNLLDRARIGWAVTRYDLHLDVQGVSGRRRRDLRRELRANLTEAAGHAGAGDALRSVGPLSVLAREAVGDDTRPRWTLGAFWGAGTFALLFVGWMLSTFAYLDGVQASGVTGRDVTGTVFPWGQEVTARVEADGGGLSIGGIFPLAPFVLGLVVFLVAARPWRAFTGRHAASVTSAL